MSTSQVSPFRHTTRFITTHDKNGKGVIHSSTPGEWQIYRGGKLGMNLLYTTTGLPQMSDEADIKAHERVAAEGTGLVNPGGSLCRLVDFGPADDAQMHRTRSLDYGVVLEGEMEMILDSGETVTMGRGDVMVQRGTDHAWRNASKENWARMMYVLLGSEPLKVGDSVFGEELSEGMNEFQSSRQ